MRDFPEVIHLERSDGEVVWMEGTSDSEEAETAVYRLDTGVISDVAAERRRQIEYWGLEHDDDEDHQAGEMVAAAIGYAMPPDYRPMEDREAQRDVSGGRGDFPVWATRLFHVPICWTTNWLGEHWNPKDRRQDLVRAAALIVAEIERLDRAANASASAQ